MEKSFKIPIGITADGLLVDRSCAVKGVKYFCPECNIDLIFRAGAIKAHHFSHKSSLNCQPETVLHKTAKLLIKQEIELWKRGEKDTPHVLRKCLNCYKDVPFPLPNHITHAEVEYRDSSGRVVDVALLSGKESLAFIEVLVTHEVDEQKSTVLTKPWIEVQAKDIVDNPSLWVPAQDEFFGVTCKKCKTERANKIQHIIELANKYMIILPIKGYRVLAYRCWNDFCSSELLLFQWRFYEEWDSSSPPYPIPKTVCYREYNRQNYSRWANVCPVCNMIQGDKRFPDYADWTDVSEVIDFANKWKIPLPKNNV